MDTTITNITPTKEDILLTAKEIEQQLRELFLSNCTANKMQYIIQYIEQTSN